MKELSKRIVVVSATALASRPLLPTVNPRALIVPVKAMRRDNVFGIMIMLRLIRVEQVMALKIIMLMI